MRIRTIKPEFWESESLGNVSRNARLLFIGLFSCCDDSGRTRASSRLLASRLFPYDNDAMKLIPAWLRELEDKKCVRLYQVDGDSYLDIPNWLMHQKIDKPSKSKLPSFESVREDSRGFEKNSLGTGNREGNREQGREVDSRIDSEEPTPKRQVGRPVDDAFIAAMQAKPVYAGINIANERQKCETWCEVNAKTFNQQRLTNWLNNCTDRQPAMPVQGSIPFEDPGQHYARIAALPKGEPVHRPGIDD
jgi:hypothetical protein